MAKINVSTKLGRRVHLVLAITWLLLLIPAITLWQESILFVIIMSIYANVEASMAAREAKKSGDKQDEKIERILELLKEQK